MRRSPTCPFTLLGYGTDIDVANVLRAGHAWLDDGDYELSRGPGAAVHELAHGRARPGRRVGAVNLASVAFAVLALWSVQALLPARRRPLAGWSVVVLATNPWFWIAATSLGDFVWALGLVLAGAVAAQRDRRVVAGVLFGLAIGCRASSVLLVVAWLLAEGWATATDGCRGGPPASPRSPRSSSARCASCRRGSTPVGRCRSSTTSSTSSASRRPPRPLGGQERGGHRRPRRRRAPRRRPPTCWRRVGRWQASVDRPVRRGPIVFSELLFFRLPFKPLHLLPVVAGIALLVGASPRVTQRFLAVLVVAQLAGGVVGTTLAAPDVEDAARSGADRPRHHRRPAPHRRALPPRRPRRGPWPDPDTDAARQRAGGRQRRLPERRLAGRLTPCGMA